MKLGICLAVHLAFLGSWCNLARSEEAATPDSTEIPMVEPVLITAARVELDVTRIPASVEVLDADAIEMNNALGADELFRNCLGIDLQGSGVPGSGIKLNMRGLTPGYQSKRLLVLVDGRRLNDSFQGNVDFSLLPADNIDRVEILRGPASALYGSNALGGVVNIITRRGRQEPHARIRTSTGSHGTWNVRGSHGRKAGGIDYFLNASHVQTDGYMNNSDGSNRDWLARNLAGNLGWRLDEKSVLRVFAGYYTAEGTDESSERQSRKDYQAVHFRHNWDGGRDSSLRARLFRNGGRHEYDWKYPGEGIYDQYVLGGEIQQTFRPSRSHRLTFGAESRVNDVNIDEVTGPIDQQTMTTAVFGQDELNVSDSFLATVGLRYDLNDDFGNELSPRLGLLYRLSPSGELFTSINRAHRAPALSDRFVKIAYAGFQFEGNPDLSPETLTAYELGFRYRSAGGIHTEMTVFYNDLDDSFDFAMQPDGVFRNQNVTDSRSYGIESSLRYWISPTISTFLHYSYMDGEYTAFPQNPVTEGNRLAYLANTKASFGLTYARLDGVDLSLSCRFASSRFGDVMNSGENRMDGYLVVDWRSRVRIVERLLLTLNVDNLFDERFEEFPGLSQPGRSVMIGMEIDLAGR